MIDFRKLDISDHVEITCVDGEKTEGIIISMEDEEESELGEIAVVIAATDGRHVIIGQSEMKTIDVKSRGLTITAS